MVACAAAQNVDLEINEICASKHDAEGEGLKRRYYFHLKQAGCYDLIEKGGKPSSPFGEVYAVSSIAQIPYRAGGCLSAGVCPP
jgi:hypothetical protein